MTLKLIRSILNLIPNYSDFDFFMSSNGLGFIVLDDDQGNHLPKFKVQIKNKFFGFIFKELNKNEPRKLEEIKISHDEFQITSTNIKLKNDKMYYVLKYSMPFVRKTKELVITAN